MATMKGLALGQSKPVVGISSLEALAYNVSIPNTYIAVMVSARKTEIYGALYSFWENSYKEIIGPASKEIMDFLNSLENYKNNDIVFIGDGVNLFRDEISKKFEKPIFLNEEYSSPRGFCVCKAVYDKVKNSPDILKQSPKIDYLKKSQAEREYNKKQVW